MTSDEEIKLSFLLSGSCDLPPSYIKLRSYLNIHLSNVADQYNLKLLKSFRNRNKTCPYCYSSWSAETASLKLLPTKKFTALKAKRDGNLQEIRNTLVLKCKVCTKKSLFSLTKGKHVKEKEKKEESVNKKKESRDLIGRSNKIDYQTPGMLTKKKKSNTEQANKQQPQKVLNKSTNVSRTNGAKKLVPNPFAIQTHPKKKDRKFERLKQAIKQDQGSAKKTLQDFLSLV